MRDEAAATGDSNAAETARGGGLLKPREIFSPPAFAVSQLSNRPLSGTGEGRCVEEIVVPKEAAQEG